MNIYKIISHDLKHTSKKLFNNKRKLIKNIKRRIILNSKDYPRTEDYSTKSYVDENLSSEDDTLKVCINSNTLISNNNNYDDKNFDIIEENNNCNKHCNNDIYQLHNNFVFKVEKNTPIKSNNEFKSNYIYIIIIILCGTWIYSSHIAFLKSRLYNSSTLVKYFYLAVSASLLIASINIIVINSINIIISVVYNLKLIIYSIKNIIIKLLFNNYKNNNSTKKNVKNIIDYTKERKNIDYLVIISLIHGLILGIYMYYIICIEDRLYNKNTQYTNKYNANSISNFSVKTHLFYNMSNSKINYLDIFNELFVYSIPLEIVFGGVAGYIYKYTFIEYQENKIEYLSLYNKNNLYVTTL